MLAKVKSYGLIGIDGYGIEIEIDVNPGLPGYDVVGLADTAIKESKERVKSAIKNCGYNYPINKIIVNLAPAWTKKEGSLYDLPIALGILVANGTIKQSLINDFCFFGELSLDGKVRKVNGVLPMLISAKQKGYSKFVIPYDNALEASFIDGIKVYPVRNLREAVAFVLDNTKIEKVIYQKTDEIVGKYVIEGKMIQTWIDNLWENR